MALYFRLSFFTTALLVFIFPLMINAQECSYGYRLYPYKNNQIDPIALVKTPTNDLILGVSEGSAEAAAIEFTRFDIQGNIIWQKNFPGSERPDKLEQIIHHSNGFYYALYTQSQQNALHKSAVIKFDGEGNFIWFKQYAIPDSLRGSIFKRIVEVESGKLLLSGHVRSNDNLDTTQHVALMKIDANGEVLVSTVYKPTITNISGGGWCGTKMSAEINDMIYTIEGKYLFCGNARSFDCYYKNALVFELDTAFNLVWSRNFYKNLSSCNKGMNGYSIIENTDKEIFVFSAVVVFGICYDAVEVPYIIKLNANGVKEWEKQGSSQSTSYCVIQDGVDLVSPKQKLSGNDGSLIWEPPLPIILYNHNRKALVRMDNGDYVYAGERYIPSQTAKYGFVRLRNDGYVCSVRVGGQVYWDNNQDCDFSPGIDSIFPNALLHIPDLSEITYTDSQGRYSVSIDTGSYQLSVYPPNSNWTNDCNPSGIMIYKPVFSFTPDTFNIGLQLTERCPVVSTAISWSSSRICDEGVVKIKLSNDSPIPVNQVTLQLTWPTDVQFISCNYPSAPTADGYSINVGALAAFGESTIVIQDSVLCNAALGTEVCFYTDLEVEPVCSTYQYALRDSLCSTLRNSYDPNDKIGYVSKKSLCFDGTDELSEYFTYQINCQNTGNDTAYTVRIIDTLDLNIFDIRTLRLGPTSHPYTFQVFNGNILCWTFNDINLLATSQNEAASKGFATFSIKSKSKLNTTVIVANKAAIYFDTNSPIITAPSFIQSCQVSGITDSPDIDASGLQLYPNPASQIVTAQWATPALFERMDLYSSQGVLLQSMLLQKGKQNCTLSVSLFPKGTYWVVFSGENSRIAKSLILR